MECDFSLLVNELNRLQIFHYYEDSSKRGEWDYKNDTNCICHITDEYLHRLIYKIWNGRDPIIHDGYVDRTYTVTGNMRHPKNGLLVNEDYVEEKLRLLSKIIPIYSFKEHALSYGQQSQSLAQKIIGSFYMKYYVESKLLYHSTFYECEYSKKYDSITREYLLIERNTKQIIKSVQLNIINFNPLQDINESIYVASKFIQMLDYSTFLSAEHFELVRTKLANW